MAPVLSSDGSERSRSGRQSAASSSSVRKGAAGGDARSSSRGKKEKGYPQQPRQLRRPRQETVDLMNETLMSVQSEAAAGVSISRDSRAGPKHTISPPDLNENTIRAISGSKHRLDVSPEDVSLPPTTDTEDDQGSYTESDSSDDDIKYEIDRQGELEVFQPFPINFQDFMHQDDYSGKPPRPREYTGPYVRVELEYEVKKVERPIGITILVNGNVVVGDRGKNLVVMFDQRGRKIKTIEPGKRFKRPSDMTTLSDGRFAVRDDLGLQMFSETGEFLNTVVPRGVLGMCFGLATDGRGNMYTINTNRRDEKNCLTKKGSTDILVISVESGQIIEQIELDDIIRDKRKSQCKFLCCDGRKLYISDLGLNQIYIMPLKRPGDTSPLRISTFGEPGQGIGQFKDVAGIVADSEGNIAVVDACNNRIQVFNTRSTPTQFIGMVRIPFKAALKRPSGIVLDMENQTLYVLNLWSNSMSKFKLVKP